MVRPLSLIRRRIPYTSVFRLHSIDILSEPYDSCLSRRGSTLLPHKFPSHERCMRRPSAVDIARSCLYLSPPCMSGERIQCSILLRRPTMANSLLSLPSPVLARTQYVSNNTIAAFSTYGSMRDHQRTAVVSKQNSKKAVIAIMIVSMPDNRAVVCVPLRVPREVGIFELRPIIVRCQSAP